MKNSVVQNRPDTAVKDQKIVSLIIAVILLFAAIFSPAVGVLTSEMTRVLLVIVAAIILWVKQPVPLAISSLLIVVLLPLLRVTESLSAALAGFTNASTIFVIASFGVAVAIQKTSLPGSLLAKLLKLCKGDSSLVVLAFMAITYIISSIISDIAAVVIFLAFADDLLSAIDEVETKKKFGRLLLLSIPFASIIGGTATPAGSTINVMAISLLQQNVGVDISFAQWMLAALPVSIVQLFVVWFLLTRLYPVKLKMDAVLDVFQSSSREKPGLTKNKERLVLLIIVLMVVLWIASSWIPVLNTTTVAIIGLVLFFLPGIQAFSWKEFKDKMPWEIPLMGVAVIACANAARSSGLVGLFVDSIQGGLSGYPLFGILIILGTVVTLVLLIVPVGPAAVSMLTIPFYTLAASLGMNPLVTIILLGIFASNCSILPLNAVFLLSYTKGYWKIPEIIRVGAIASIIWLLLAAAWMTAVSGLIV